MITLQKKLIFGAAAQILIFTVARAEDCGKLAQLQLGHVTVTKAQVVPAGSSDGSPAEKGMPAAKTDYCRVQGTSRPTADSENRFELWIPSANAWNGKFEQVGNGGFAGSIPYQSMARVLSLGAALRGASGRGGRQGQLGCMAHGHGRSNARGRPRIHMELFGVHGDERSQARHQDGH